MIDALALTTISFLMGVQYQATPWYNDHSINNGNCLDVSREQVAMLRKAGYNAYQLRGHCSWNAPDSNHAFIGILDVTHNPRRENWYYFDIDGERINAGWNMAYCQVNN